jgi:ABC-type cobalamin/Fe3+-siderophores transport system ATPase subunit
MGQARAFALIGANGAGKTTTIKVLMNIFEPTRGSATLLGVDSRKVSRRELAQIGYVSENQDMPARLTVGQFNSRGGQKSKAACIRRSMISCGRRVLSGAQKPGDTQEL